MPAILTIPAAALLIGVSRTTLWTWVQTVPEWRACVATQIVGQRRRRTYLSSERLRRAGLIGAES